MAALGVLAVGLSAAMAWWLAARLAAPVNSLARLAVRLGDGDFSSRYATAGVAELDRAGDALNRTAGRLGDTLARERSFTADVSHQLNTPLTSLRLGLESALLTAGDDASRTLEESLAEVERLQATVATLLAVARDVTPAGDPADVAEVCESVVDRYRGPLADEGRPLRLEVEPGLPAARCPAEVLREILSILLDNADHHGKGTVTVTARSAGRGVIVEVSDEGPGITGDPDAVFARRGATASGYGIGLSLARSLAEAHDARLELTRAAPRPTFTLALPGA
jgi:signal transduction histidine kinase